MSLYHCTVLLYGAGRTRKTGAPRTGTPVTPRRTRERWAMVGGCRRGRRYHGIGGDGDRKCSSATSLRTDRPAAVTSVRVRWSPRVKSRTRSSRHHGLRDKQYGDRSRPSSSRKGAVPAVDGTAFQRRSDATAQRQFPARLRELGYVLAANPALQRTRLHH